MNNKKDIGRAIDFHEVLVEKLKNPRFKKLYDKHGRQLELAYSLLQLRKKKKISQAALAAKIGTTQSILLLALSVKWPRLWARV